VITERLKQSKNASTGFASTDTADIGLSSELHNLPVALSQMCCSPSMSCCEPPMKRITMIAPSAVRRAIDDRLPYPDDERPSRAEKADCSSGRNFRSTQNVEPENRLEKAIRKATAQLRHSVSVAHSPEHGLYSLISGRRLPPPITRSHSARRFRLVAKDASVRAKTSVSYLLCPLSRLLLN